ncbi:MAG: MBL fold metallo-hydrolase [Chloroflexota bacterium]|nr:MBL fold metallo-hydrolase [Chloroflexota bacterium]
MDRTRWAALVAFMAVLALMLAGMPLSGLAHDEDETAAGATPGATPGAGPLPETTRGPAIPEKGYLVEEIRDGLYWVTEGSYQAMFLTTGQGVIVVDAPPSIGEKLLTAIAEVTAEPVTHVVYSHTHADHIGAAHLFPDDATYVAHEATAAQLAERNDPNRPVPTVTFADSSTLTVGDQTLELTYRGNNHEPGNIFVYAPKQKVLMLVDIIFPGWVPFQDLALAEDVPGFVEAHDEALAYDFETFVGGHLTRLGTRQDIEVQREYVLDIRANAAEALQTVDFMAIAQQTGFENQWLLFDTYLDAVAQACTDATLAEWDGRLGGAEVYTFGHCWTMMESLRID